MTKTLIASNDPTTYNPLADMLRSSFPENEIVGFAQDGPTLLQLAASEQPDIVITEALLSGIDGMECIRQLKHSGLLCKFIVISDLHSFDSAYKAIKTGTKDYFLKPIDTAEFLPAFQRLIAEVTAESSREHYMHAKSIRRLFLLKIIPENKMLLPLSELNNLYLTNFREGIFRYAFVMLDFYDSHLLQQAIDEQSSSLFSAFDTELKHLCYDAICERQHNGNALLCFLNYPDENDPEIQQALSALYHKIKAILCKLKNLRVSICVSDKHFTISESDIACHESDCTRWVCRINNTNSVVYYEPGHPLTASEKRSLELLCTKIKNACEALDISEFEKQAREFFSLPKSVLCQYEVHLLFIDLIDYFFSINARLIDEQLYSSIFLHDELIRTLSSCDSFFSLHATFISRLSDIMLQLVDTISLQKIRTVRRAVQYVRNHYQEPLSLSIVADEFHLSSGYFSAIFKKELGQNFTDFVNEYRISIAKNHLKEGDMSITEICEAVGYVDQCYFSKIFKKYAGVSPKEYRRIFDKSAPVE